MTKQEMQSITLTAEQVDNWRKTMFTMMGPVAFILPDADIQKFRDRMQELANNLPTDEED